MTKFGTVEYAEHGSDEPLLAVHGFFGGCDEALLSLSGLVAGRRVIAPSRFGYLGSSIPPRARPWRARPTRSPHCLTVSG